MTRTENEQELVLGNKQLLSAFFVVVALLGVFFAMGYVMGRNTNSTSEPAPKRTALVDRPPDPAAGSPTGTETIPPAVVPIPQRSEPSHIQEPVKTESVKPAKIETPKPAPVESAPDTSTPVGAETTAGHTYLQVMAVKRPVADSTVKMLKGRGFPALLGESSKPDLYRVLVGPFNDTESIAKAKTDLKKMGFDTFLSK